MATPLQQARNARPDDASSLRSAARKLSEATQNNFARQRFAQNLVFGAVQHYWRQIAGLASLRLRRCFVSLDSRALSAEAEIIAQRLGTIAASLDPVHAAHVIGRTYTASLPSELRTTLGIYYTPPAVAERLLNHAERAGIDWREAMALDPACGGGAFLAPLARRMSAAMKGTNPQDIMSSIEARLRGYEVDAFSGWMSQVFVDAVLLETISAAGRAPRVLVSIRDTLDGPLAPQFDLVVGNPPYGRLRLNPERRARYARTLFGHANLYGLFTDYALQCTKTNGVICYVTPTGFLGGEYFKSLRSVLAKDAPPEAIDFVAIRDGVFDDVLQETLLAVYRKNGIRARVAVSMVEPVSTGLRIQHVGAFELPSSPDHPWVLPRSTGEARVAKRLAELRHRLSDWGYSVSTGPLVWNRHKDQLRGKAGPRCVPLIWAEAVRPDGTFDFRAEKKNHSLYFKVLPGDGALLVKEPCVLVQRTTAKEQSRRLIAAELPASFLALHGHVTVENHLNMVRPLREPDLLRCENDLSPVAAATLTAFLNTKVVDRAFRCLSGSVAVSAFELESLPLPDPATLGAVETAVKSGAPAAEIESLCSKLYGF